MPPIPRSIRDMANEFGVNRVYLSGWIDGNGMHTFRGEQNSIYVSDKDYRLLRARFAPLSSRRKTRG